jgi:hypothetical protein
MPQETLRMREYIENIRWVFILVGVAGGLSLIGAASVILAGTRFS